MFEILINLGVGSFMTLGAIRAVRTGEIWAWWTVRRSERPFVFWALTIIILVVGIANLALGVARVIGHR